MGDPLRKKMTIVLYTSLALLLGLGLASGFKWVQGGEAATLPPPRVTESTSASAVVDAARPSNPTRATASDFQALEDVSKALIAIAERVKPAVVSVQTSGSLQARRLPPGFEDLFGRFHEQDQEQYFDVPLGRGSGFVVSEEGYIITNNHVVRGAERIDVELSDGRLFQAELIGRDPTTDVAVLKIDVEGLPYVTLGDPDAARVGEFVMAIGNPGTAMGSDLPFTVTTGIISAKGRDLRIIREAAGEAGDYAIEDFIQTDAVINPGNSGGPLVDYRGEVIGVNTAIQSTTGYYQGYGFAIPISLARDVMEDLIEYGRVRRAALRVQIMPPSRDDVRAFGLPGPIGAVVQDFTEGSPAAEAGMQRGDVIVAVDGKSIERVGQLQRIIASYEPGDRVKIKVVRFGEELTLDVRLAEQNVPQPEPTVAEATPRPGNRLIGIQVLDLDPELAARAGFRRSAGLEGALVTDVMRFGPAWNAGLGAGWLIQSVNRQPVTDVASFDKAVGDLEPGELITIEAVRATEDGEIIHRIFNMTVPEE
ncbi:MAG: trypsin-like peptidase domain-containing protein [Gemmatimonadales bacterium]|jgi:serine protease Do